MTSAPTPPPFADTYDVERELGRGGMATVYLAHDRRHGRRVAVKVLRPELASSIGAERFVREVRIVAGLVHPHILPLHDSGVADGMPFYVMPFVEGETLRDRLARGGPLSLAEAVRYATEVADALAYAHERGVVHRDVKPENVLLSAGHALLTDFGVAHALQEAGAERLTATGIALGTPAYMSPEQAGGEPHIDGRSDVFSLGTVLYEMLSGASPFAAPTLGGTLSLVMTEEPPPITVRRPDAPRELSSAIARALAKDPKDRFPTARAFADALASVGVAAPRRPRQRAILAVVSLSLAGAMAAGAWLSGRQPSASAVPSVAVLPFTNETGDTANAYFGAGIADELLTALTDVPGLRVASRTSSFSLAATPGARDAARHLGVGAVLAGSVRRSGGTLRVTATLYDAARDSTLWTKRFDRPVAEVFQVQEDIARAIVKDLRVRLAADQTTLVRRRTTNAGAHELVLRARAEIERDNREGSIGAVELLQRAETLDSNYAEIYALRARVYQNLAIFHDESPVPGETGMSSGELLRRALIAATRAVELDGTSASAHLELARQIFRYEWDWAGTERELQRARELNGAMPDVYQFYSRFQRSMGRFAAARAMLDTSVMFGGSPALQSTIGQARGRISYFAREYDRAARETLADTARRVASRVFGDWLAQAQIGAGRYADAWATLRGSQGAPVEGGATVALLYARTGHPGDARAALERFRRSTDYAPTLVAGVLAALGDTDAAIAEVEQAIATHDPLVVDLKVDPRLDPLRRDPRFQRIVARLNFPR